LLSRKDLLKEKSTKLERRVRKTLCKMPIVFSARDYRGAVLPIDWVLRGTRAA